MSQVQYGLKYAEKSFVTFVHFAKICIFLVVIQWLVHSFTYFPVFSFMPVWNRYGRWYYGDPREAQRPFAHPHGLRYRLIYIPLISFFGIFANYKWPRGAAVMSRTRMPPNPSQILASLLKVFEDSVVAFCTHFLICPMTLIPSLCSSSFFFIITVYFYIYFYLNIFILKYQVVI